MTQPSGDEPTTKQRAAFQAGRDAYTAKFDSSVCPYTVGPGDPLQLAQLWLRGYVQARHEAEGLRAPFREVPEGLPGASV